MTSDTTIDAREVDYYTELADTWWDRDGPFWPLHKLNALRVDYIRDVLCLHFGRDRGAERPLTGLRVLDVGCGGGILSESMATLGASVTGIDVVEKNIRIAALHAREEALDIAYRCAPAGELADAGEQFDIVLNMEVVEHVADLDRFMQDCCRLTHPDGVMFVSTINRTPLSWLFAIVGAEYILGWLPRGTHRWSLFRKPAEIRERLAADGFAVRDMTGVAANPFRRSLRRTSLTAVNYMLYASRRAQADTPAGYSSSAP